MKLFYKKLKCGEQLTAQRRKGTGCWDVQIFHVDADVAMAEPDVQIVIFCKSMPEAREFLSRLEKATPKTLKDSEALCDPRDQEK